MNIATAKKLMSRLLNEKAYSNRTLMFDCMISTFAVTKVAFLWFIISSEEPRTTNKCLLLNL